MEEKDPMQRRMAAAALAVIAIGTCPAMSADSPPLVGRWHWNVSQSSATPGEPAPRVVLLVIDAAEPAHVRWTLTLTDAAGGQHTKSFNGSGDGKRVAVSGAMPGTTAAFTVTPNTFDADYKSPDGGSDRSSCALSPDRQKLTCRGSDTDGQGHATPYVDVYDRQ
jgi:hypothetical protein